MFSGDKIPCTFLTFSSDFKTKPGLGKGGGVGGGAELERRLGDEHLLSTMRT